MKSSCSFNLELLTKRLEVLSLKNKKLIQQVLVDLIAKDEYRFEEKQEQHKVSQCPHCSSKLVIKNGKNKTQIQTYKCKDCNHYFNFTTGLSIHGIHDKIKWGQFLSELFSGNYLSIRKTAERLQINSKTVFNWRHRALYSIHPEVKRFSGITEVDDLHFVFSEKGRKGTSNKLCKKSAGDNNLSVKVLATSDRVNTVKLDLVRVGRLKSIDLKRIGLKELLNPQANILVSDSHASIVSFGKKLKVQHQLFKAKAHVKDKVFHVNTINEISNRLKLIVNKTMRGVATKYLQNYLNLFKTKELMKYRKVDFYDRCFRDRNAYQAFKNRELNYKTFLDEFSKLKYNNPVIYG